MKRIKVGGYQIVQAKLDETAELKIECGWIPDACNVNNFDVCNFFVCDTTEKYIGKIAVRNVADAKKTCEIVFERWDDSLSCKDTTKILNKVVQWLLDHGFRAVRLSKSSAENILEAAKKTGFKPLKKCDSFLECREDLNTLLAVISGLIVG